MFDLILSGGRVFREDSVEIADVAIAGETIAEIAPRLTAPARRRLDAAGLDVLPGLIDPHVHLGLTVNGASSSDDVASGTRAALHGGVTTVLDFSRERRGQSLSAAVDERKEEFRGRAFCDHALHANVTEFGPRFAEDFPIELENLAARGCSSLKVFTTYSRRGMMIPAHLWPGLLRAAAARGFLVLVHAEEDALVNAAADRLRAEGRTVARDFPRSRPGEAEVAAVREVAEAAVAAAAPVYFVHLSTAGGLAAVRAARRRARVAIHAETCPQYLLLTEAKYAEENGHRCIVTPPLRAPQDREALRQGLRAGEIDVVATDHCPFWARETDRPDLPCTELPSGLPGIETRLPLLRTLCAAEPAVSSARLVELLATRAARIFGLYPRKGVIRPGADADLVLLDPAARWEIRAASLHMRCDHSPYEGMRVSGRVRTVLLRGRVVLENEEIAAEPCGRYLGRTPASSGPALR